LANTFAYAAAFSEPFALADTFAMAVAISWIVCG